MGSNVTREDVVEQRNKYGRFDDDLDELAALLDGREPSPRSRNSIASPVQTSVDVDESFWRETRSESKYGR